LHCSLELHHGFAAAHELLEAAQVMLFSPPLFIVAFDSPLAIRKGSITVGRGAGEELLDFLNGKATDEI
jgi:hypothetical protein